MVPMRMPRCLLPLGGENPVEKHTVCKNQGTLSLRIRRLGSAQCSHVHRAGPRAGKPPEPPQKT